LVGWALKIFLIVTLIAASGMDSTSVLGLFAGAILATGLALQVSCANFDGDFFAIFSQPYMTGDLKDVQGKLSVVKK